MAIPVRHQRQRFLAAHMEVKDLAILEIGAFDAPTWIGTNIPAGLRFLDWYSTEELYQLHQDRPSRHSERRIEVDYVVKDKQFSRHVADRFDLVVANHVLEHIADPIAWLVEVAEVTAPTGRLCMAVPDRRYTFDYLRPESTAVDLVRARDADLHRPGYWQVLDAIYLYRPIRAEDCWPGPPAEDKLRARRFDLKTAMAHARRADQEYVDCHCFVFSEHTFAPLIAELNEADLIPWRVVASRGVEADGNEFMVMLEKKRARGAQLSSPTRSA